ncbi:MAG: hypothetical protein ABIJ37_02605 [Pseudomonadota bacterium]
MNLDKNDMYILKFLPSYKKISIILSLAGGLGTIFGSYLIFVKDQRGLNIALTGASLVVLGSNYLSICIINVLEKFKSNINNDKDRISVVESGGDENRFSILLKSPLVGFIAGAIISLFVFWVLWSRICP